MGVAQIIKIVPGGLLLNHNCRGLNLDVLQVIKIQPDESIYLKINNKLPGLGLTLDQTKLDLTYSSRYQTHLPDAYERLILDVINGDKRLFIRNDELEAAWKLFTPILQVCFCVHGLLPDRSLWLKESLLIAHCLLVLLSIQGLHVYLYPTCSTVCCPDQSLTSLPPLQP